MAEINFIDTDAKEVRDTIIVDLENGVTEPLYPGDERRIFGEAMAQLITSVYNTVNDKSRQRLLRYARGTVLDALGENRDTPRLESTKATATQRFGVNSPIATNVIIPAGLRVSGDFVHYFLTEETVVLPAGSMHVDVTVIAENGGDEYNGIATGEIKNIVDISDVPMLDYTANIDATAGGGDSESDDAYRERIRSAENKLSTAGPSKAYKYYAISANPRISDAVVESEKEVVSRGANVYENRIFIGGSNFIPETLVLYNSDKTVISKDKYQVFDLGDELLMIQFLGYTATSPVMYDITRNMYGRVKIVPICAGGELPDEDILADVLTACSEDDVRPLTDMVIVAAPDVEQYDIELTYYVSKSDASKVIDDVESDGGAIDQYIFWQDSNLDQDINPEELFVRIKTAGASRVEITKPAYKELPRTTVAKFSGNLSVNHVVKG